MPTFADPLDTLAAALGLSVERCRPVVDELTRRYRAADRHYHTLDHILAVLDFVQSLASSQPAPALVVAVWFHDAVYDSRAGDNEERSAALTRTLLAPFGIAEDLLAEVERLILLTKTHRCTSEDRDGQILLDADLAILGTDADGYDAYARAIRREYAWVPEDDYRKGRTAVLEGFLKRERIYWTEMAHRTWDEAARRNLRREIGALAG